MSDKSSPKNISRREFLSGAASCMALAASLPYKPFSAPYLKKASVNNKVIVIGIDGMDPILFNRLLQKGEMPNFRRLMEQGYFSPLKTTMPPQSPVAWSSFITGCNPGGHGVFDFIHRDPDTFSPYLSISRAVGSSSSLDIGKYSLPLKSGRMENLRRGPAFWTTLEEHDIPSTFFALPSNFPVVPAKDITKQISGMGTPDLLGTYGMFTFYSDVDVPGSDKFTGGRVEKLRIVNHSANAKLKGPANSFRNTGEETEIDVQFDRDPSEAVVRIKLSGHEVVLKQGEWSEWLPLKFEMMAMFASISGMVRIYVQEVHPHLKVYISPINIDPMDPTLPICSPAGYSKELSQAVGRFYTKGFPEDNKALSHGVFSNDEFFYHAKNVLHDSLKVFDYQFSNFKEGLFFFYFSSVDQNSHMLWRLMDPTHPLYEKNASPETKEGVFYFYREMDKVLAKVMSKVDNNTTLLIMSDHGFAPFTREFNASTWLIENGYMTLTDPDRMEDSQFYNFVDWSKTKAYVMGLNGIYLNLAGREKEGSVRPPEVEGLIKEIIAKLKAVKDPKTGASVMANVYDSRDIYSGPFTGIAPDIILGYNRGYRISDGSALGKFPRDVFTNRVDKWSADHCMDWSQVPGVLFSNKQLNSGSPAIIDLAPTIIKSFGLNAPGEMDGKALI